MSISKPSAKITRSDAASGSSSNQKRFTENWLQSLTLAAQSPAARLIKPLLTDIDNVSQSREPDIQSDSAKRLWEYASGEGLLGLLQIVPTRQPQWQFDDEMFLFTNSKTHHTAIDSLDAWQQSIGISCGTFPLTATTTASEWAGLVRDEAVRQRRSSNVEAASDQLALKLNCQATWNRQSWSICFDKADWIVREYHEPFETDRPMPDELLEILVAATISAEQNLLPKNLPSASITADRAWMQSIPSLELLHQNVFSNQDLQTKPWFRKVWAAVWPVIYREQNRLDQPCDINLLRAELAACFTKVPKLTVWTFVAAKLLCVATLGRGLGICGDYRR